MNEFDDREYQMQMEAASADCEVIITSEMMSAGLEVLMEEYGGLYESFGDAPEFRKDFLTDIFSAMDMARAK